MTIAVVALGSNLGDRAAMLRRAAARLDRLGQVRARSSLHETTPVGPPQPEFLNAIILLETALDARTILDGLLAIERELGRVRTTRWAPRTIDLDLVALGETVVDEPGLTVPHPRAHERAFVLGPLVEVAPELDLPGRGRARELWEALTDDDRAGVRRSSEAW